MNYKHGHSPAAVHNGWVYQVGGGAHQDMTSGVERAQLLPGGGLSSWIVEPSLAQIRSGCGIAIWQNSLYVVGGHEGHYGSNPTDTVRVAQIGPSGILGAWTSGTTLPNSGNHAAVVVNSVLYALPLASVPPGQEWPPDPGRGLRLLHNR